MEVYIVQPGDTLFSIARMFRVPTERLLAINPEIGEAGAISVGQPLRVPSIGLVRPSIEVNAYTFPVSDPLRWSAIFPFLTYLSIFGHDIRSNGTLTIPNSAPLIDAARKAGVAPLLVVTNTVEGVYSGELLHDILSDTSAQQALLDNIIAVAQAYGYYGVSFGFELVSSEDYLSYVSFLELAANRLHALGLIIVISIPLVMVLENTSDLTDALSLYNRIIDRIIIVIGDFVCTEEQVTIDSIQLGTDIVTNYVSNKKILLGVPSCCYTWYEPFSPNNGYSALSTDQADALVRFTDAYPETDPDTRNTFFRIKEGGGQSQILMCDPLRSMTALELVSIYNLAGISFRSLSLYGFTSFQTINVNNDIRKVLT